MIELLHKNIIGQSFALFSIIQLFSVEGEKAMLSIENTKTGNFCLSYACNYETDEDRGQWDVQVSVSFILFNNVTV